MIFHDGSKYRGEFKDGKMSGKGLFIHATGERFMGEFLDDQRHGFGIFTDAQGRQTLQRWQRGKLLDLDGD